MNIPKKAKINIDIDLDLHSWLTEDDMEDLLTNNSSQEELNTNIETILRDWMYDLINYSKLNIKFE